MGLPRCVVRAHVDGDREEVRWGVGRAGYGAGGVVVAEGGGRGGSGREGEAEGEEQGESGGIPSANGVRERTGRMADGAAGDDGGAPESDGVVPVGLDYAGAVYGR